ncbi:MAG TPA: hypothetical protein PK466_07650 [Thermotogota bacterium]|nr:hypothetical protein [Thermotogota bacterium]HPR96188.1 hypothetical protein [Thermotogota bacterium]
MKKALLLSILVISFVSLCLSSDFIVSEGKSYFGTFPVIDSYPDVEGKTLTDGEWRFAYDESVVAVEKADINGADIIVDLGEYREDLTYFAVKFMLSPAAAVVAPYSFLVSVSEDDELYEMVGMGTEVLEGWENERILTMFLATEEPVEGQFVKFSIRRQASAWVLLSEVQVGAGELPEDIATLMPGQREVDYDALENLAAGMPYFMTPEPSTAYPDEGEKVTDGSYAYSWADMIGFKDIEENPTIILDLGDIRSIERVAGHFMCSNASAVPLPYGMIVSVSEDDEIYKEVGIASEYVPYAENEKINEVEWKNNGAEIKAQFVKVEILPKGNAWTMLAEVEVFGK